MAEETFKESRQTLREVQEWRRDRKSSSDQSWSRSPQDRTFHNWALGEKNPKWRTQVILGQNATTPFEGYSYNVKKYQEYHTYVTCYPKPSAPSYAPLSEEMWGTQFFTHPSSWEGMIAGIDLGEANSLALSRLVEDIRDKHAAFKGSTSVAELAETIRMLRNPAKALRKGVGNYLEGIRVNAKRWSRQGPEKLLDAITGSYLEYAYGWTPLIAEISEIRDVFSSQYKKGLHERVWAYGIGETNALVSISSPAYWSNYYTTTGAPKVQKRQRSYAKVIYTSNLGYTTHGSKAKNLGFTPKEWLPALWEVIPYSFVVDYFSNIGEIISAVAYVNSDIRFTNKTTVQVLIEDYPFTGHFRSRDAFTYETKAPTVQGEPGAFEIEGKRVYRSEYLGSLVPPLRFSMPGSGRKWLNLAMLGFANHRALKSVRESLNNRLGITNNRIRF